MSVILNMYYRWDEGNIYQTDAKGHMLSLSTNVVVSLKDLMTYYQYYAVMRTPVLSLIYGSNTKIKMSPRL